ncbi:hypothetical protein GCM10028777_13010 [Angustibacter speluncae]
MPSQPTGHHGEKQSETLVRLIIERSLGARVCCYDDRDGNSKPDAIIHRQGGVPLEIVSDPHKGDVQLLNALGKINGRVEIAGLSQGYWVCLTHKARVNDLGWLEQLLHQLEDPDQWHLIPHRADEYEFITTQGYLRPGQVILTSGSGGGRPLPSAANVVKAACDLLGQPAYADVARKLAAYGGAERHAVLIVDEQKDHSFDWLRVASPGDASALAVPELVDDITHLWITSRYVPSLTVAWSRSTGWEGFAWSGDHPVVELNRWDDPRCPDDHTPNALRRP